MKCLHMNVGFFVVAFVTTALTYSGHVYIIYGNGMRFIVTVLLPNHLMNPLHQTSLQLKTVAVVTDSTFSPPADKRSSYTLISQLSVLSIVIMIFMGMFCSLVVKMIIAKH